jgi:type III secretory pathway component EscV
MPIILEAILSITSVTTADMGKYIVFTNRCGLTCPVASPCPVNSLSVSEITDCVRMAMRRYISHKFTRGGNTLVVYLLSRKIEERLRSSDQLSSEDHQKIMAAVAAEVVEVPMRYQCPVILTSYDIRRQLRNMLELEFPFLAVLSYQELSPDMNIQPIARIEYSET